MTFYARVFAAAMTCALMGTPVAFAQSAMSNSSSSSMQMTKPGSAMMMAPHKKPKHKMTNHMSSMAMSNSAMTKKTVSQ
jgi:hypothetical protein